MLELNFNMDGLPLFKSSSKEFWPFLGQVHKMNYLYEPFPIAVYCGDGKPKDLTCYLGKFVDECNLLEENGIDIGGKHFQVREKASICDRPARSLIKCIKGHTCFCACERCEERGYRLGHRTLFPGINSARRTDDSFRRTTDKEHHIGEIPSPLTSLKIDMVKQFILDFMHLGCLGVMKKMLGYWTSITKTKLSRTDILRISLRMMNLSSQVPIEFQRYTRSLGELSKWKATEYRFFLLYCGLLVLKDILPAKLYEHFSLFSVACRILSCEEILSKYLIYAEKYSEIFVQSAGTNYGPKSQVLNMHSLIHLADDVRNMQCSLSDLAAFSFGNKLRKMKKSVHSGKNPLSQWCRRMELDFFFYQKPVALPPACHVIKSK